MRFIRYVTFLAIVLSTYIVNAQVEYIPKLPTGGTDMEKERAIITEILKNYSQIHVYCNTGLLVIPKEILVLEDRIEVVPKKDRYFKEKDVIVNFSDILNYPVKVQMGERYGYKYFCVLPLTQQCLSYFVFTDLEIAKKYADFLFLLQYQLNEKRYTSQLVIFEPIAANYRSMKVKPLVSEAQREYIVQANSFNQEKNYSKAIELYNKAIELNQTAYPDAYTNLALLSAQINEFDAAIYYMKKYLLLEPEASDARSAQDKIYEWKAKINK